MDPVCGAAEVAELLGVSRQRVQQLAARPDFPAPVARLSMGAVWWTADVIRWAKATGRLPGNEESEGD